MPKARRCQPILVPGDCAGGRDHVCRRFKKAPPIMVDFFGPQSRPRPSRCSGTGRSDQSQVSSTHARLLPAVSLCGLPFANVRTAVYVQHLAGHLKGFGQIKDGVHDVFHLGNPPRRLPVNQRILRDSAV